MVWINCGLDHCGLDQGVWKPSRIRGNYYMLLNLWLGSIVVWIEALKSSRVRGNYYILQNSWLGSIVVCIKAWKSPRVRRYYYILHKASWLNLMVFNLVVQLTICSIVLMILLDCFCSVGTRSIQNLFNCPIAQLTFCSIVFCTIDLLFNSFLFNWLLVQ